MEKAARFLGIDKGLQEAVKNVVMLLLAFGSIMFTAGTFFGNAKDVPERVSKIERRQDIAESELRVQLQRISEKLDAQSSDIKELRSCMLSERSRK